MIASNFRELETLFLALGDKTRLRLLALMADGPVAVGFLADRLGESQPKVSRHLAYLRNAGVVYTERDGKWIYYGIRYPKDASLRQILETVISSIAVMRIDGKYVYFTEPQTFSEETPKTEMYAEAYEDEPDDEDNWTDASQTGSEEMDIFLL